MATFVSERARLAHCLASKQHCLAQPAGAKSAPNSIPGPIDLAGMPSLTGAAVGAFYFDAL